MYGTGAFGGVTIAVVKGYNPDDTAENLREYAGVALAFVLSVLVIWLIIRKDLRRGG